MFWLIQLTKGVIMEAVDFGKEALSFNKTAFNMGFEALSTISSQAEVASDFLLSAIPSVPEEGKSVVNMYFRENKKGLANLKKHVEDCLDIDWTATDAPAKNLEAVEYIFKGAFNQIADINNESKELIEKSTTQLSSEAKSQFGVWNESFNSCMDFYKSCMSINFEVAKTFMTSMPDVASMAVPKAAK